MAGSDGTDSQPRRRPHPGYIRQIHLELVLLLVVISAAAAAVIGWSLRPQSSGFPTVPENLSLSVSGDQVHALSETLMRTSGNVAMLELLGSDINQGPERTESWKLSVGNLGAGRVCTPSQYTVDNGGAEASTPLQHQVISHPTLVSVGGPPVPYTDVESRGFFYVASCFAGRRAPR
jgi:hypothetical protein